MVDSTSLILAKKYLGQSVTIAIDRPLGTKHKKFDMVYPVNYGFVPDTKAPDGEELDAYVLGIGQPVWQATGRCIAIIHRLDDDDDKLVVVPEGKTVSDGEIRKQIDFQEQYYKSEIIRE